MNQSKPQVPLNQLLYGPYQKKDGEKAGGSKQVSKGPSVKNNLECKRCVCILCVRVREREIIIKRR